MTGVTDLWVIPGLATLADWSVRWGLVIAALAAWLAVRPPRRAASRYLLCASALVAGLLLPATPRWCEADVPWPSHAAEAHAGPAPAPRPIPAKTDPGPARLPMPAGQVQTVADSDRPAPAPRAVVAPRESPTRATFGPWRVGALLIATVWATVVVALLTRLAAGRLLLARLRGEAVAVGAASEPLLAGCRDALRVRRPVALATHPVVASPVVVGGRRPLVLVPADWDAWTEPRRRACLLHELAHLARRDDWFKLAQELVRAPFWFHPAVRWLLARLDRERELLCDEAVVALGCDPLDYARLLLDLARRPGRLAPATTGPGPGWLPFLDRRTVAARIERLLEDDMPRTLSRPSLKRALFLGALALATALGVGGLRVRAVSAGPPPASKADFLVKPEAPADANAVPGEFRGVVLGPDGQPVPGATVVAGAFEAGRTGHQVITTDALGRFTWPPPDSEQVCLVAYKDGLAASAMTFPPRAMTNRHDLKLLLDRAAPFAAALVDGEGGPVVGAKVRIEMIAHSSERKDGEGTSVETGFTRVPREVISGSPIEGLFVTTTDARGLFTFRALGPGSGLRLGVTAADGRVLRTRARTDLNVQTRRIMEEMGFATAPPGETTRLVAAPAARIAGRVVTDLAGVSVAGLKASFQDSRQPGVTRATSDFGEGVRTDGEGRFAFDGLNEGAVNVFVLGNGENREWTYRAARDVTLTPGKTAEVTIELVRGVDVTGTVVTQGTGAPVEGAGTGSYGPNRPRTSAMTTAAKTDAWGRYRYRLPAGETVFYVMSSPKGFTGLPGQGSSRTVTIPDGATSYEVPPIELAAAVTVRGRVVDAAGSPVAGATVVGVCEDGVCRPFGGTEAVTDARGGFRLAPSPNNLVAVGKAARLLVRLGGGEEHEAAAVPDADGSVTVRLPVAGAAAGDVKGPAEVAPDELAGVVVDTAGKPVEGAEVDAWTWYPGHETRTDARGLFRIGKLDKGRKVEVVVRKAAYTPQLFLTRPTGAPGWVVVLGDRTYFEGRVTGPDGEPVAAALIRANDGPKRADGVTITEVWTEAKTGADGRYRMYAQADVYDVQVRVPGVGVARLPDTSLAPDEAKRLDIRIEPGVTFRAKVVDSLTGEPVRGVRLWHWQHPGVEGRSGGDGVATVPNMMPGRFDFQVDAPGYARWWSDQAASAWSRRTFHEHLGGWQRNFDRIDFDLRPGMGVVTIAVERAATVTGRVLDPDGKPVAGATVAPALTGTGNSLTGDTRFSVETGTDGIFTAVLPAGGDREYNLVVHDGKYQESRTWANGVLPPFRTKPGEEVEGVELRLTRPAAVRGRVTDADGKPVAGREVRASAADRLENRYYDPTTRTGVDGRYELQFVRPGVQFVQVAPFWLDARQAPDGTSRTLTLNEGQVVGDVDFRTPKAGDVP